MTGAAATGLRLAFDLAVDKQGLATTVCHNLICSAATGGLITTGLIGNGGPNSDPLAKFDPTKAKSLLKQYDPTGSLTANLTYSYNAGSLNESVAEYLQNEWQTNLGVNVTLNAVSDASIFISNCLSGKYDDVARRLAVRLQPSAGLVRQPLGSHCDSRRSPTPADSTTPHTTAP